MNQLASMSGQIVTLGKLSTHTHTHIIEGPFGIAYSSFGLGLFIASPDPSTSFDAFAIHPWVLGKPTTRVENQELVVHLDHLFLQAQSHRPFLKGQGSKLQSEMSGICRVFGDRCFTNVPTNLEFRNSPENQPPRLSMAL